MKNLKFIRILSFMLLGICLILIYYLSSQSAEESTSVSDYVERLLPVAVNVRPMAHFIEFMFLGIVLTVLAFTFGYNKVSILCRVEFVCIFAAVCDEVHQYFVPGRSSEITDVLIDSLGSIVGIMIATILIRIMMGKGD